MHYDLRKLLIFFLILVLPAFVFKEYHVLKSARQPQHVAPSHPQKAHPSIKNSFVIVHIANEHSPFSDKIINSICHQDYSNFRVIYVQNGNHFQSNKKMENSLFGKHYKHRFEWLHFTKSTPIALIYQQILQDCSDTDIIVQLSEHNWLARDDVLSQLNDTYQDSDVWLAYGNYLEYPSLKKKELNKAKPLLNSNRLLKTPWAQATLRSFQAGLLKQIDLEALATNICGTEEQDYGFMGPMLNLAKWHVRYIPEVLSVRSYLRSPLNGSALLLGNVLDRLGSDIESYAHLAQSITKRETQKADIVILSSNQPHRLEVCLESVFQYVSSINTIHVIYQSNERYHPLYLQLQKKYSNVAFHVDHGLFKHNVIDILQDSQSTSDYAIVATDNQLIQRPIALGECISAMEQTKADVFYLNFSPAELIPHQHAFSQERIQILQPDTTTPSNPLNLILYRKKDLVSNLKKIEFSNPSSLAKAWEHAIGRPQLGLSYERSHATSLN